MLGQVMAICDWLFQVRIC